jgi:hypothetical protein
LQEQVLSYVYWNKNLHQRGAIIMSEKQKRINVEENNILPSSHPCYGWWKNQLLYFYALSPDKAEKIRSLLSDEQLTICTVRMLFG